LPKDDKGVVAIVREILSLQAPVIVLLERIAPGFPGTGKVQMAKLYGNYRMVRGILVALGCQVGEAMAARWQSTIGVPRMVTRGKSKHFKRKAGKEYKRRLKERAQELFPECKVTLKTADALLLAECCRRHYEELKG
jgi:hypothetical protein